MKNIILPSLVVLAIVGLVVVWGSGSSSQTAQNNQTSQEVFFDENAKVMYFYSESCSWCQKEKEVLSDLAKEGYKVKPMDVVKNQDFWQKYDISGTPTFIAPDGQRLVGYQKKEKLKEFLDKYK